MTPRPSPTSATIWLSWANSNGVSNSPGALRNSIPCIRAGTTSASPGSTTTVRTTRARSGRLRRSDCPTSTGLICWSPPPKVNWAARMQAEHCRGYSRSNRTFQHTSNCENGTPPRMIWITSSRACEKLDGVADEVGSAAAIWNCIGQGQGFRLPVPRMPIRMRQNRIARKAIRTPIPSAAKSRHSVRKP
jgi:hypothetical protein